MPSNCGAGKEGSKGFQPGNTCAGDGGGERKRVERKDLSDVETDLVKAMGDINYRTREESIHTEDIVQALYEDKEYAIDLMLTQFEDVLYDDEGEDLIKWHTEGDDVVEKLKDYFYTLTQDWMKETYPDEKIITVYRGDYTDNHGDYTSPQFVTTDVFKAHEFAASNRGDMSRERTVVSYEVPVEDILMCQECIPGHFSEDAFMVSPDALKGGKRQGGHTGGMDTEESGDGGGSPTSTPEFKSWFGDSKVVDDSGEPMVVYHGTSGEDFEQFETNLTERGSIFGVGSYFTSDPDEAGRYSKPYAPTENLQEADLLRGRVYPVYLKIENPMDTSGIADVELWVSSLEETHPQGWEFKDTSVHETMETVIDSLRSKAKEKIENNEKYYNGEIYRDLMQGMKFGMGGSDRGFLSARDVVKNMGFDGVIYSYQSEKEPSKKISNLVAFDPTQIKSATGNKGSFDPDDPKITHKREFASNCGAGKEGSQGFQPGNTCAGDGGGSPTSTPEFKSWFGDSKVVDDSGEPMVVYHGTLGEDFDEFRPSKATNAMTQAIGIPTYFFSDSPATASTYGENVNEHYVSLQKPFVIEVGGDWQDAISKVLDEGVVQAYTSPEHLEFIKASEQLFSGVDMEDYELPPQVQSAWEKLSQEFERKIINEEIAGLNDKPIGYHTNYDGIIMHGVEDMGAFGVSDKVLDDYDMDGYSISGSVYVAFSPNQIKSATANKGTFDPDDPKITHKREFAKKDKFDEMFEIFKSDNVYSDFETGINIEALESLERRVPVVRTAFDEMVRIADEIATEVVVAERLGILPYMESTSSAVHAALKNAFWVSDVDHETVVNIQKLLGDAVRGIFPDEEFRLPDFIDRAKLEGASNLTDARLETIYRTNLSTSANEGTMSVLRDPDVKELYPLVMIAEIDDDRSRPHHAAMDGYITTAIEMDRLKLRPPNGYNCRGTLIKVSWDEANDMGLLNDTGLADSESIRRYNTSLQHGLIASGIYPDEGFKTGGRLG